MTTDTTDTTAHEGQEPTATDTTATDAGTLTLEAAQAELAKVRKEAAKYRTKAKELEDARAAAEAERLKAAPLEERLKALEAEREALAKKAQEAESARTAAERRAALTGRVADPNAALKLLEDDDLNDDGTVNVDGLLAKYPFLAPAPTGPTPTRGAAGGKAPKQALTLEDVKKMTPAEVKARWDEVQAVFKR